MEIKVSQNGKSVHFEISGNIDEKSAAELKERFVQLSATSLEELVIDLRGVSRIGSSGIGKFLLFYKTLAVQGGRIRVENAPVPIYSLFKELKLDTLFPVSSV